MNTSRARVSVYVRVGLLVGTAGAVHAADGTWISDQSGSWSQTGNWQSGIVASGAGYTATFNPPGGIDVSRTVTLDGARTLGHLVFFDDDLYPNSWNLSGSALTLNAGAYKPTITTHTSAKISSLLAGTDGFLKEGSGTLTLAGMASNTIYGTAVVNAGTLMFDMDSSAYRALIGDLVIGDGVGVDKAIIAEANAFAGAGGNVVTVNSSGIFEVMGGPIPKTDDIGTLDIQGGSALINGTLILWDGLIMTGGNISGSGYLKLTAYTLSNPSPGAATIGCGVRLSDWLSPISGRCYFTIHDDALNPVDMEISGEIRNNFDLYKQGTGSLKLSGDNTSYTYGVKVHAGAILVGSANGLGVGSSAIEVGDTIGSEDATLLTDGAVAFNRLITVRSGNTGTITLGGQSAHDSNFAGRITLQKNATLTAAGGGTVDFSGGFTGTGNLTKLGEGAIAMGVSNFMGSVTIREGAVKIASIDSLGPIANAVYLDGGTLWATADVPSSRDFTLLAGGGTFQVDAGKRLAIYEQLDGVGRLIKEGEGTLYLSTDKTYTGGTTIKAGVLELYNSDTCLGGAAGNLIFDGGTLTTVGSTTINRNVVVDSSGGTFDVNLWKTVTLTGGLAGSGELRKTDWGTLALAPGGAYTGRTVCAQGYLTISADSCLGAAPASPAADQLTFTGGRLQTTATCTLDLNRGILADGSSALLYPASGTTLTVSGPISGSGSLAKYDAGTLVLASSNSYEGTTYVGAGMLRLASPIAIPSGSHVTVASSGTLHLNGYALDSAITTYGLVSGDLDVQPSRKLDGTGTVDGHVNVANGGTVAPGGSAGVLSVTGDVTFVVGATLAVELGGTLRGNAYDALVVNGQVNLGGTLDLTFINGFQPQAGNSFDVLDWGSLSGEFDTLNLPALPPGWNWDTSALTTTGVLMVANADSDDDGVPDELDLCPNTVPGAPVDSNGCPELIPGDFNRDGDVDDDDYSVFESCVTGPAVPYDAEALPPGCTLAPDEQGIIGADFDDDYDVDESDFGGFQRCYSGEGNSVDPACAN